MGLKGLFKNKITMTLLQSQCMIIITLFTTLLLLSLWPRFLINAMMVEWYVYLILIIIFSIPLFRKNNSTPGN